MHATETLAEADRLMTICNACRYCEGLCAVFPAVEMRRTFSDGDLDYLAHLCHACGACFYDCQFSPPHEFNVNVPQTLAKLRSESYARHVWPKALAPLFARNGLAVACIATASMAAFLIGLMLADGPARLLEAQEGFYRLMPHHLMVIVFGAAFLYAIAAITFAVRAFWREIGGGDDTGIRPSALWRAIREAGHLRYLDGGGAGCMNDDEEPRDTRRLYHHFTFYGFLLCFASTSVATLYHYGLGRVAPYPWWDLPVVLGTLGGIGLIVGPIGLLRAQAARDPALRNGGDGGMDKAFTFTLLILGATGLALMLLRATPAMGIVLALHLGAVFAFFLAMPYGKFMHGLYRFAALIRAVAERDRLGGKTEAGRDAAA
jgi:citrate/tricarballylate utilization protein